jgi:NADH:ubiquinone oxidoreductase subunit K
MLFLSACLFALGLIAVITRRNAIVVLLGIELLFNAANLNFIYFAPADPLHQGRLWVLLVMAIAAAEAAVGLALVLRVARLWGNVNLAPKR